VHARRPELPVVLLTGWGREISAKQMRDGGIAAVLTKPVEGPALRQAVAAALTAEAAPLRVLIVDDSGSFAAVLAMLITQAGHRVASVDAASAALDALARDEYDLVMLDANLPDRPAADVVPAARAAAGHPMVCVVSGGAVEAMAGTVPGADLFVEKVRLPERLEEIVRRARSRG
jgi:two-component system OmpR family response regulator